jgi:hypothetical protein
MSVFRFVLTLIFQCAIEVAVEYKLAKLLLCRTPVEKLAGAEVANYGKIQKKRVAQQVTNPLVRSEVSLREKRLPIVVELGQLDESAV